MLAGCCQAEQAKFEETLCMRDIRLSARRSVAVTAVLTLAALTESALGAGATPDISGTYWATEYHPKLVLQGGGAPPLNADGQKVYAMNQAGLKGGSVTDVARKFCVPDGLPRAMASPYPLEIIQAPPGQITIVHELNHQIRVIAVDKPLPSDEEMAPYPFYNGHSVGHWEGDTLVAQTAGFNEKTFLDATGLPHDDMLGTTERFRKISSTQLEDVVTIRDPTYYTRDFSTRFVYQLRNDVRLENYVCGEPHRDISKIKGVPEARAAIAAGRIPGL
jgi:hypothetical protein